MSFLQATSRVLLSRGASTATSLLSSQMSSLSTCLSSSLHTSTIQHADTLSLSNINERVIQAQYAVRGELVLKAESLAAELKAGKKLPFERIILCNIGNPQELGQKPITFFRQVLALCQYPQILQDIEKNPSAYSKLFAADAVARAKKYLAQFNPGAYSSSMGIPIIREEVARFLQERDGGAPVSVDNIFLTDGASSAVKMLLSILIRENKKDGVLTPIPQYPLYSATLTLLGGEIVPYYLNEEKGWDLDVASELQSSVSIAEKKGINPRALVIINPGNPTGQCLNRQTMEQIVKFCEERNIVLMADEVYQTNVYSEKRSFTSFKKVVLDLKSKVQLVSFHSVSKGFLGECGQRGGYMELYNIDKDVKEQVYKLASISLCSNTTGQIMTGLMVNPPRQDDASYVQYEQERTAILSSLQRRAKLVAQRLNKCTNISCNEVEGALYAFPSIKLPEKAVKKAQELGKKADVFYALELLQNTGICVVPGSGFGQKDGTFHFRTTILPGEEIMTNVMDRFERFHEAFMKQYS